MNKRNYVNLNVNPCKMCMPMGAVTAFKGIENSMVILHGSQGCSTYIRRHMAGHYNEPVDIASSSLNEKGTVYGGENNLKKGLQNIIKLYNPGIIGVATTCLAETIGEDIRRITGEFTREEGLEQGRIVPVSTPGYGGTQYEGFFAALTAIVKMLAKNTAPNGKINIIANNLNPGDIRNIKEVLEAFKLDCILLPDVSDTLDAPYKEKFGKIPEGGTKIEDIRKMAGARATVEMGLTVPESVSPGQYLHEQYGVPLYRCPIPIGLENTDRFVGILSKISEKRIPLKLKIERGRLLDGMIDSHKYNAEGRAVIYGEPDQVYAVTRLCSENGIQPVLACTGDESVSFRKLMEESFTDEKIMVLEDTDFETIQRHAKELNANLLVGNSDGKVITEKEGIPLVRMGFPIHDRVGGQRLAYTGYSGSLKLLDDMTNTLLEGKYENYRQSMLKRFYREYTEERSTGEAVGSSAVAQGTAPVQARDVFEKTLKHPCFSGGSCKNARMHIPVAPACNISCNYCSRKYDCVNESRPGVTSEVLTPGQAAEKFAMVKRKVEKLTVVGIAGPGDALADFQNTKESIELIRKLDEDVIFCLSTNGLMLPHHAEEIIRLGVTHVTVTVNAVDPEIGARIYRHIDYMGRRLTGVEAAAVLMKNQLEGLKYLAAGGVICKVNIVMIKGVNDFHIEEVVKKVKECGAHMTNIMPLIPARGSAFENIPLTSARELNELRKKCEADLKQMYHCKQCRADAIGPLDRDISHEFRKKSCGPCEEEFGNDEGEAYVFAVATRNGMSVDLHFGHAEEFHIYEYRGSSIRLMEKRKVHKYCSGSEECDGEETKTEKMVKVLEGCTAVLVLRIGYHPVKLLEEKNIKVIQTCDRIEDAIRSAVREIEKECLLYAKA